MRSEALVEIKGLHVHFPLRGEEVVRAVNGVSFDIKKGETLAIVGESGSGKSITAMSIMRLNDEAGAVMPKGEIFFRPDGREQIDLVAASTDEMQEIRGSDISMIFQEPMTSLNPVLTIGFQISEAIIRHQGKSEQEAQAIALETLRLVRMPEAEKRLSLYPHHLSGGMRQRVMIAMALACRPQLLIADEPTTALDVTIQAQILDLIRELQHEIGMSVLFITHDMGVVAEIADRVIVMLNGEKVEENETTALFHAPEHPYTQALLNAVPRLGSMTGKDVPAKFQNVAVTGTFVEAAEAHN